MNRGLYLLSTYNLQLTACMYLLITYNLLLTTYCLYVFT